MEKGSKEKEKHSTLPKVIAFTILGSKLRTVHSEDEELTSFETTPASSTLSTSLGTETDRSQEREWHSSESSKSPSPRRVVPTSGVMQSSSGSSEDGDFWEQRSSSHSKKLCLSCGTKKTPRWHKSQFLCSHPREFLCNACAIRIKKYHFICAHCHFALNKDQQMKGICPRCKRKFSNLIKEDIVDLTSYTNQLDSILASTVNVYCVC